jgi:branched-chain amino acid transport system ATP-binding protein
MLEVVDLAVAYGPHQAVRGISFRVGAGQIVSLVGANGAGKSTTLAAVSGLVRPARGRIVFEGHDLTRLGSDRIVRLGVVQVAEGRAILAGMTVTENLELGGYHRRDRPALRREMAALMERFPILGERRDAPAGSLSGGEQQMLAIARGLLARPRLFLLDEPSMGLAPRLVAEVFRIIAEIHAAGTTILLVEQNARRALSLSDYAYVLETGRIVLEGPGPALLTNQATLDAYLGSSMRRADPPTP